MSPSLSSDFCHIYGTLCGLASERLQSAVQCQRRPYLWRLQVSVLSYGSWVSFHNQVDVNKVRLGP